MIRFLQTRREITSWMQKKLLLMALLTKQSKESKQEKKRLPLVAAFILEKEKNKNEKCRRIQKD